MSLVALAAMALLFSARYFSVYGKVSSTQSAAADSRNASDPAIELLSRKIASENEEHQALESKRLEQESSLQQLPAVVWTPVERKRRELASQLVHLLALEKQYSEGSPEITNTRAQIDSLQSQIAEMPSEERSPQITTPSARTLLEAELAETDHQISLRETQTNVDIAALGRLVRAKEFSASPSYSPNRSSAPSIVLISLSLGLIAGLLTLFFARVYSVRNESILQRMLPATVEVIAEIPHMQAGT